ncbi:hypothetical protein [Pseudoalteromonas sp. TB64]|uniref:hypothetical protein n=1 Tax=Pseudoalteromonas sp. TB64 TaxID=1938600 RepID=UPI00040D0560|nr:hypothetical protein [Pseudoalteromonas sp. TB64]
MHHDLKYGVEHMLSLFASSYLHFPANALYDEDMFKQHQKLLNSCHIYIIGLVPKIAIDGFKIDENKIVFNVIYGDQDLELPLIIPAGFDLAPEDDEDYPCLINKEDKLWLTPQMAFSLIHNHTKKFDFDVLYIGQAYGKNGSRNARDRLLSHGTLQKISLTHTVPNKELHVLVIDIKENNQVITMFNHKAKEREKDDARIKLGLEKIFNTSEHEQVCLFEAAFIKYFEPKFNKEFKNSFPSTNLKILQDCYEKDFASICAEINLDGLPFHLKSGKIESHFSHMAHFNIHGKADREAFFSMKRQPRL